MDERLIASVIERLNAAEKSLADTQRHMATIDAAIARLEQSQRAAHEPPTTVAAPAAVEQILCSYCHGGNPPDAGWCIWCGRPMQAAPTIAAPSAPAVPPSEPGRIAHRKVRHLPVPALVKRLPTPYRVKEREAAPVPVEVRAEAMAPVPPAVQPRPVVVPPELQVQAAAPGPAFDFLGKSEFWLRLVGIGLLLGGLVFFFKYAIDKGWLNEPVRIALGLLLGTVLLGFGVALHKDRRHFSQVLLGGGVAAYYISIYAAREFYALVPYDWAFGSMVVVTALAFVLALRENEAILSLIGLLGGLLTPFVLTNASAGLVGLMTYTCILLAGTSAVYLFKGWRSLLWASYLGGWAVMLVARYSLFTAVRGTPENHWALQAATLFGLLAFWAVPVIREVLYQRNPQRWAAPALNLPSDVGPDQARELTYLVNAHVHVLVVLVPLLALGFSQWIWEDQVTREAWGWITLGSALVLALAAGALWRAARELAYTHAMMAILFVTLGAIQVLSGDALIFALAAETVALHLVATRLSDRGTRWFGNAVAALLALLLTNRLALGIIDAPGLNWAFVTYGAVILLMAAGTFVVKPEPIRAVYRNLIHVAVLIWIFDVLRGQPGWTGWVMLAWGAYAVALTLAGRYFPSQFAPRETSGPANGVYLVAAAMFAWRIVEGQSGAFAFLNWNTLADAVFIGMTAILSLYATSERLQHAYRIAVHLAILAVLWREIVSLPGWTGWLMLAWGGYALALTIARRYRSRLFSPEDSSLPAHGIFLTAAVIFAWRIVEGQAGTYAVLNWNALADLVFLGMAVIMALYAEPIIFKPAYLLGAYVGFLALLWRELISLPDGNAYLSLAWGVCGIALLVAGLQGAKNIYVVYLGEATLGLVVAKLLLVDFAAVDPLWRVLLFMGFGGALLMLSYYVQNAIRGKPGLGTGLGGIHLPWGHAH